MTQKRKKPPEKKEAGPARQKKLRLSKADIKHFRQMLLEKRREILVSVGEFEGEALKKSRLDASGDLSSMPIHMADLATDNYEQEFALGLMGSEIKLLREIDDALARIDNNTYGICEGTGRQIPKARLEAQPWARCGVEYARTMERSRATEKEE